MLITIKAANFKHSTQEIRIQRMKIYKKNLGRLKDLNRPRTIGLAAGLLVFSCSFVLQQINDKQSSCKLKSKNTKIFYCMNERYIVESN